MRKRNLFLSSLLLVTLSFSFLSCKNTASSKSTLTISAAASLKEAMSEIQTKFEEKYPNVTLTFNFGSSGSLQKQIEQGAPADIFISAAQSQMNSLIEEDLILENSNRNLVNNELVLITNKDNSISTIDDLNTDEIKHIALGEPSSVPAGVYAKETLTNLKLYDSLSSKIVFAKDVKEVLAWVATGNCEAGFVYKSDALTNDKVKIIDADLSKDHTPIIYPIGIIKSSSNKDNAQIFEDFLYEDTCTDIFKKYGYEPLK